MSIPPTDVKFVEGLDLWDWQGCDENAEQWVRGLVERIDHLREVLKGPGHSLACIVTDFRCPLCLALKADNEAAAKCSRETQ